MSLTSIMSAAGLTIYPIVALVLFLTVFLAVMVRTMNRRSRETFNRCARIPLDDAPLAHQDTNAHGGQS
jgi:cbb3-type cytochrome oxidase subunit 3